MNHQTGKMKTCLMIAMMAIILLCCGSALTESSGRCGENVNWILDDDGILTISGYGDMRNYDLYSNLAPWSGDTVKEVTFSGDVTSIGTYAFYNCKSITGISIPNTVRRIFYGAFYNCTSLSTVTIPDSITDIGGYTFYGCSKLTDITIPDGITEINPSTFQGCSSLSGITIPDSVTSIALNAFTGCSSLTCIQIPENITSIKGYTFSDCSNLKDILIPDGVTEIGKAAFMNCGSLESIRIPSEVAVIGEQAFTGCTCLTEITIPEGVTEIGKSLFKDCSGLETVNLSTRTTDIGESAFESCSSLIEMTIPEGVTKIEKGLFKNCSGLEAVFLSTQTTDIGESAFDGCSSITGITIPESVSYIGDGAFRNCSNLETISLPANVTCIGKELFKSCGSLENISIPGGVTEIGENAFNGCTSLYEISIPAAVTNIGSGAFRSCGSIRSLVIPEGVTGIDSAVFYACGNLESVTIPHTITDIGNYAFYGCGVLGEIIIPDCVTSIGSHAFYNCSALKHITIPDGVTSVGSDAFDNCPAVRYANLNSEGAKALGKRGYTSRIPDTCLDIRYIFGNGELADAFVYRFSADAETVSVPEGVTGILSQAFRGCEKLTSVELPGSIRTIETYAFDHCTGLTDIIIQEGIKTIKKGAFRDCVSLRSILIPDGVEKVENETFMNCSSLTACILPQSVTSIAHTAFTGCSSLTEIVIPYGVTAIEAGTFAGCSSLTTCFVPDSVTSIGSKAFYGCSSLTFFAIPDGVTSIEEYTFSGCEALTVCIIPESVTDIGKSAFDHCSSLMEIEIPESVTSIEDSTFYCCGNLTAVNIPNRVTRIGSWAFAYCSSLTSVTIPDSVTSIESRAFNSCSGLAEIFIPDSVASIEDGVFMNCSSLTEFTIPDKVTSIESFLFYGCINLKSIFRFDHVTSIGVYCFYNCPAKKYAKHDSDGAILLSQKGYGFFDPEYPSFMIQYSFADNQAYKLILKEADSNITKAEIPDFIWYINSGSFSKCRSLVGLEIPESVEYIADYAFCSRSSSGNDLILRRVMIPNSVISIGNSAFPQATTIYCYQNSKAEEWANENGNPVVLLDAGTGEIAPSVLIESEKTIPLGFTRPLDADIFPLRPDMSITYTSENEAIVTISDTGIMTPVAPGQTRVTVTVSGVSESCMVTVVQGASDFVIPKTIYVEFRSAVQIPVTNMVPENAIVSLKWETADHYCAEVDQTGLVTAREQYNSGANTIVTVTDTITGLSRTAMVYVIEPISRVSFESEEYSIKETETLQLSVSAYRGKEPATDDHVSITYTSSDPSFASVDKNGLVTGKSAGTAVITATAGNGVSGTCKVHVVGGPMTAPAVSAPSYVKTGENMTVSLTDTGIEFAFVTLKDSRGDQILQQRMDGTEFSIPTELLPGGNYTLEIQAGSIVHPLGDPTVIPFTINKMGDDPAATVDLKLQIIWEDQDNIDGLRPAILTYRINGEDINPELAGWTATIANAPKYHDENLIDYLWSVSVPAGYEQTGIETNGYTTAITLKHTHLHSYNAEYQWNEDKTACTVVLVCDKKDDTQDLEAVLIVNETISPTCTSVGEAEVTAVLVYEGITYSDQKSKTLDMIPHTTEITKAGFPATCTDPGMSDELTCTLCREIIQEQTETEALGHDWQAPVYQWSDDYLSVTAFRICEHDHSHKETETVSATYSVAVSPTETADGTGVYTSAAFENEAFTIQTVSVMIPRLPPSPVQPEPEKPVIPTGRYVAPNGVTYMISENGTAVCTGSEQDVPNLVIPDELIFDNGTSVPVTAIQDKAFSKKIKLKTVTVGKNIRKIGKNAFSACKNLMKVKGGRNVEIISDNAFASCSKLKTFPVMSRLKNIGNGAFNGDIAMTKFTIGANVERIGKKAFFNCSGMKNIKILSEKLTGKSVGANAFKGTDKAVYKCPKKKLEFYKTFLPKKGVQPRSIR